MPFRAFEGPAGTGKTTRLIAEVRQRAAELQPHERVLGLTFMHGSRRRLDESFAVSAETRGRSHAMTVDSFAAHVVRRWRALAPPIDDFTQFDQVCDACGELLERPEVVRWVTATFPVVAIDEAQELKPCRLRIAQALAGSASLVVAADEFQCLDEGVDTGPFSEWFETGDIARLTVVRRTGRQGLLNAGVALRASQQPLQGAGLRIRYDFPQQVKFTVGHALRNGQGTKAILVAPGATRWANELVPLLAAGLQSPNQQVPPLPVTWETAPGDEARSLAEQVCGPVEQVSSTDVLARLVAAARPAWADDAMRSIDMARRAHGRHIWDRTALHSLFARRANLLRAYARSKLAGIPVMSIQAAKNRQFRDVVVLWAPGVPGSDDHKRRLLYNAISRAEQNCTVMVRTQQLLNAAPFS